MHHHDHKNIDNVQQVSKKRLGITIFLNFLITVVEIIGGIVSGSLSLISDALHNFSDGIAVILSYFAVKLNEKPKNEKYTFGYKRAEILTAVFNASVLIGISIYLFIEAIDRLSNPSNIDSGLMIWVASIGLVANIAGTLLLKKDASHSLNIKSAYLHLLSDAISSAGVILGGFAIYFYDILWIDPLLTILISAYIIKESY
ncbi:MAG: cation transporter, partial [Bacteroidetes bacterium]